MWVKPSKSGWFSGVGRIVVPLVAGLAVCIVVVFAAGCGEGHSHDCDEGHSQSHENGHDHHHDHTGPNPHFWLDPVLTKQAIQRAGPRIAEAYDTRPTEGEGRFSVVVSIYPLEALFRLLLGHDADVQTLLPPGASPHGFELNPNQMRALSEADVLVAVGGGVDPWAIKAARNARGDKLTVIDLNALLKDDKAVVDAQPHHFRKQIDDIVSKLDALNAKYKEAIGAIESKELVTFHNAFDLLAERYGLNVLAHLTEVELSSGGEVTPAQMKKVQCEIKAHQLKVLYAEPQFPESAVQAIKQATGVEVLRLDPLGHPNRDGYRGYFEMMASNLKTLVDGQGR